MSKTYITKLEFGFPDGWVADGTKSILWEDYFVFPYVGKKYNDDNNGWLGNGYMCKWPEEYPKFFEEVIEENKSNDSFQWDDSKVKELLWNRFPFPEGVTSVQPILDEFKKNYTPKPQAENKPDWEIVSYKGDKEGGIWTKETTVSDKYLREFQNPKFWLENKSRETFSIHSVKRLSDGEVFSVGDEVFVEHDDAPTNWYGKITGFWLTSHKHPLMHIYYNGHHYDIKYFKKKLPPQPQKEEQGVCKSDSGHCVNSNVCQELDKCMYIDREEK